jgi:hypothetical protein
MTKKKSDTSKLETADAAAGAAPLVTPAAEAPAKEYEFHPYADLLPMMLDREFEDLKKGIRASGQQEPITLCQGKVLDGRNRLRACQELGIEPQFHEAEFKDDQAALDFVIARNLQRRNLTASQKAVVALKALPLIRKDVQEARIRKIRDAIAAKTLDGKGADLPSSEETETRRGRKKEIKTTSIVGDLFGVSATYVRYAQAIQDKDKKLLDQVIVDGRRLYDLYKEECPDDVKGRTKRGRPADPIRTTLSKGIRLVEANSDMPEVLRQLTGAMATLEALRAAARKVQEDAAKAAKDGKAAEKPAPAAPKGKKLTKKAPRSKAAGKHSVGAQSKRTDAAVNRLVDRGVLTEGDNLVVSKHTADYYAGQTRAVE